MSTEPDPKPRIGIVMGSDSDWPIMKAACDICREFGIPYEVRVLSAHRAPEATTEWARGAADRGIEVLIAGAGGAAHLPGVIASTTLLPIIGVPVANGPLNGFDALLAIVQMPKGIPVATVGIGGAGNAALLAVHMLALNDEQVRSRLVEYRRQMTERVAKADERLRQEDAGRSS